MRLILFLKSILVIWKVIFTLNRIGIVYKSIDKKEWGIIMKCYIHPNVDAVGTCTKCGKMICQACSTEINGKLVCSQCSAAAVQQTTIGPNDRYCKSCGAIINKDAEICPKCGVRQIPVPTVSSGKSRVVAAILALFLGNIGAHKFYLGKTGEGLVYLCFFWTGIPWLIAIVEAIIYLTMSDAEFEAKYGR